MFKTNHILAGLAFSFLFVSCDFSKKDKKEEQIRVETSEESEATDSLSNSIHGNVSLNQIPTTPNAVVLTGLAEHRLVTVYKTKEDRSNRGNGSLSKYSNDYEGDESESEEHFMPGIDILYGYNLLNIAHYDLKLEKLNFLFNHPVLIKTVYYPSFEPDSINKQPVNRNYYLISVYDEDTNKDTLINKKDLRHFYYFDQSGNNRIQLVPAGYAVVRSQYDSQNDVMYVFARQDVNHNGAIEKSEPVKLFWIDLKNPLIAKLLY